MPELISPEVECLKLKQALNESWRLSQQAAKDAVDRAIQTGGFICRWKELLPHGEFESFVEKHFDGSLRNAQVLMKVAKGLSSLPKSAATALLTTEDSLNGIMRRLKKDKPNKSISAKGSPGGGSLPSSTVPPASAAPEPGEAADSSDSSFGSTHGEVPVVDDLKKPASGNRGTSESRQAVGSTPTRSSSGEEDRTSSRNWELQETDPRPPRTGKCPNCRGSRWSQDESGFSCAKCHHPWGEPADSQPEEKKDNGDDLRAKAVKTMEAAMRVFDDLNALLPKAGAHKQAIELCKNLLKSAKGWK